MFRHSEFSTGNGGIAEHFFSGVSAPGKDFAAEAEALFKAYHAFLATHGCSLEAKFSCAFI